MNPANPITAAAQAIQAVAPPDYGVATAPAVTAANQNQFQNLANLSGTYAQSNAKGVAADALQSLSGMQVQDEAAALAAKQREEEMIAKATQEATDPKKYQKILNDRGGYDFFDPLGQKVSALDYAKVRNERLTDVLKGSNDQDDRNFTSDWDFVQKLGQAIQNPGAVETSGKNKGKNKLDLLWASNPELKEAYADLTYDDIIGELKQEYPNYFQFQNLNTGNVGAKSVGNVSPGFVEGKTRNSGSGNRNSFSRAFNAINPLDRNTWNTYYTDNRTGR